MTRRGIALIITSAVLFMLAGFTQTGWVQLADALLWATILLSAFLALFSVPGVDLSVRLSPGQPPRALAQQGDTASFTATLRNRWPWPRFGLALGGEVTVNGKGERPFTLYVPILGPRQTLDVAGILQLPRRGLYTMRDLTLSSSAPFGLFRRRRSIPDQSSLLVHPAPHLTQEIQDQRTDAGVLSRPVPARFSDAPAGSRAYISGDRARDIHWRNFARTGHLAVRSFATTTTQTSVLVLGPSASRDAFDDLLRLAAGAALTRAAVGDPIVWRNGDLEQELRWEEWLRRLALLAPDELAPLGQSLRAVDHNTSVLAIASTDDIPGLDALRHVAPHLSGLGVLLLGGADPAGAAAALTLTNAGASVQLLPAALPPPQKALL